MGDVLSLREKAQSEFDAEEAEAMARKCASASFDLEDFRNPDAARQEDGSFDSILKMLPGLGFLRRKAGRGQRRDARKAEMTRMEAS